MKGKTNAVGGSGGLNFKVVGGETQPADPAENTIWVNTSAAITSWVLSAVEPESPEEGMVWIVTAESGAASLNALKKNGIVISLASTKNYTGDGFANVNAMIYQGGEWAQFSQEWDGALFDNGEQYTAVTGGWTNTEEGAATLSASVWSNSTFSNPVRTTEMVDVSDFDTLYVTYTAVTKSAYFGVTKTADLTLSSQFAASKQATAAGTLALDVSRLTGEYYVTLVAGAATGANCAFTASKVWLE